MQFHVFNRFTAAVQFTAQIECDDGASHSWKLRLAVLWAIENRADLTRADLTRADLTDANLTDADLTDANLTRADLTRADLTDADLTRADLTRANLTDADLTRADLTRADLTDANLTDADLTRADLTRADLEVFKQDFIAEILKVPAELEVLRDTIVAGKINGSMYADDENGCSCLAGTIARVRNCPTRGENIPVNGFSFRANANSPRERWFMMISPGATPEKNQPAKLAVEWLDQAIMMRDHIRKAA